MRYAIAVCLVCLVCLAACTTAPRICTSLERDAIGGIRIGADEAEVRRALGDAPREDAPSLAPTDIWLSAWSWPSHDLVVRWVAPASAPRARTVYAIAIGRRGDLATSCGIRIGSTFAAVGRAYAALVFGTRGRDRMMLMAKPSVIGLVELERERVVHIELVVPTVSADRDGPDWWPRW